MVAADLAPSSRHGGTTAAQAERPHRSSKISTMTSDSAAWGQAALSRKGSVAFPEPLVGLLLGSQAVLGLYVGGDGGQGQGDGAQVV